MKGSSISVVLLALTTLAVPACSSHKEEHHEEHHEEARKIVLTSPIVKNVISTQQYVCQIHSRRHIEVRALEEGYLEEIHVKEGQTVKQGDVLFKLVPVLYKARLDTELAELQQAQIEFNNTTNLFEKNVVSAQELALVKAKLAKAQAKVNLAQAELNFTNLAAPFDGIIDKQYQQQGSLISEGDILSTLSDNRVMWVYFNVPEARYLEYMQDPHKDDMKIELVLANHTTFPQRGQIGAIEADFNNTTGNIAFRGDFPNPDLLLRNGQTGTVVLSRVAEGALVIPQRATFEILAKRYVFVVDEDHVVHQRDITIRNIQTRQDDIFVIEDGLKAGEKIVLEGVREVRDGEKVEFEFQAPEMVLANLKFHAE